MNQYPTRWIPKTVTVANNEHTANDALGARIDLTGALRESPETLGGLLLAITLVHLSTGTFEVDFFFFDDEFAATADGDPFGPTEADLIGKCIGVVTMTATEMKTTANQAVGTHECVFPLEMKNTPGSLYCQMVTRTTFTPAAITVKFGLSKD